tara:strand:+ start:138 stop:833 length:696 start_codon:yes stop_codon:yes gene_type:complete
MDTDEIDRYSTVEIEDLLSNLVQDKASLARIYRFYEGLGCELRIGLTARDIMGEVWVDTLSGKRVWKRGIDALKHFKEVGRSIISNTEEKIGQLEFIESEEHLCGDSGAVSMATEKLSILYPNESGIEHSRRVVKHMVSVKSSNPSPDILLIEHQKGLTIGEWTTKLLDLFSGDNDALCYLKQFLSDNTVKSKIMIACSFSESVYGNVRKRIKDKVWKRFPNGINWWEIDK